MERSDAPPTTPAGPRRRDKKAAGHPGDQPGLDVPEPSPQTPGVHLADPATRARYASAEDYLAAHNNNPRPLVWTATAESILTKVARGRVTLNRETKSGTHH